MNTPKLRFKEFKNDWQQTKIKDISSEQIGGGTPKTSIKEYWRGSIPWFSSSDLSENDILNVETNHYINEKAIKETATKLVPKNSIAIVTRVGVGKLALIHNEYSTSQDFVSLSNLNQNPLFLTYDLYLLIQNEKNKLQGTSIKGITKNFLLSLKINVPKSEKEQRQIGLFFNKIDNLIHLKIDKIDVLKQIKHGYMQKLFTDPYEDKPKIRFKDFDNNWNVKRLKDISKITMGNSPSSKNYSDSDKFDILVQGNADLNNGKVKPRIYTKEQTKLSYYGNLILTVRAPVGEWAINQFEHVVIGRGVSSISGDFNSEFLYYNMKLLTEKNVLNRLSSGSVFGSISLIDIKSIKLSIPTLAEQTKIGKTMTLIDKQINLQKQELNRLKSLKKGYLQKMFV